MCNNNYKYSFIYIASQLIIRYSILAKYLEFKKVNWPKNLQQKRLRNLK